MSVDGTPIFSKIETGRFPHDVGEIAIAIEYMEPTEESDDGEEQDVQGQEAL